VSDLNNVVPLFGRMYNGPVGRVIAEWPGLDWREKSVGFVTRGSGYSDEAFAPDLRSMVRKAKLHIPEEVDTLVGTGLSGSLVVPHLARRMDLHWGIVRKPSDLQVGGSHAYDIYEGTMGERWALVDDFVCTGATVQRVWQSVADEFLWNRWPSRVWNTRFVGMFQYSKRYSMNPWVSTRDLEANYGKIKLPNQRTADLEGV
jgi:hypothetical protein